MLRHVRRALTALVVAVAPLTAQQAVVSRGQVSPDTLAGRVVTDSGAPVAAVPVVVTRGPDRAVFRTMTDADGRWRMVVDSGTGDYLVYVAATGFKPSRTRVTRAGAETRLDVVLTLTSSAPSTLATVTVVARKREAPQRGGVDLSMRANAETPVDGVASNLSPAQAGDIASMAGTIPGLQVTPSGIAALGLTGDAGHAQWHGLRRRRTSARCSGDDPRIHDHVGRSAWWVQRGTGRRLSRRRQLLQATLLHQLV